MGTGGSLVETFCKVNPLTQRSKIIYTGNAVEGYEYNVSHEESLNISIVIK